MARKIDTSSHKNCLIDSSNIIYTIPEEQHKCQMTEMKKTVPEQNKNTGYLNKKKHQNMNCLYESICVQDRKVLSHRHCVRTGQRND